MLKIIFCTLGSSNYTPLIPNGIMYTNRHTWMPIGGSCNAMVPQMVAKIAICDCPMASGDCLVALIAKLAKVGGV